MVVNASVGTETGSVANAVKFTILVSLEIPSIFVSLIIFTHFVSSRAVRSADHQHSVFVLLALNFLQVLTVLPMPIDFYRLEGNVRFASPAYCIWWRWYEFSSFNINNFLMAWISIERHILIFHGHLIRGGGRRRRWLLHVAPVIFCGLWPPLFYMVVIVISPMCTNVWTSAGLYCGLPCYFLTVWNTFDVLFNIVLTTLIITVMNLALILRVLKRRVHAQGQRQINWRHQRKMVLQLVTLCSIYVAAWIPISVTQLGQLFVAPTFLQDPEDIFYFLYYLVPLILPFICLPSIPRLLTRMKTIVLKCQWNVVTPIFLTNHHS